MPRPGSKTITHKYARFLLPTNAHGWPRRLAEGTPSYRSQCRLHRHRPPARSTWRGVAWLHRPAMHGHTRTIRGGVRSHHNCTCSIQRDDQIKACLSVCYLRQGSVCSHLYPTVEHTRRQRAAPSLHTRACFLWVAVQSIKLNRSHAHTCT